ncbi:hypothetical protein C1701_11955 [Actinoalloteichus sp. AHMU CJ021]|uniref:hypothetical protein n=1 Tax=Actinoalloteichus TaxID=65496 RepID=UPI0004AB2F13|nr:hypothetical protein [Actinoalloteichus caeruleus]AUS78954.1 hypothetical protein C1701_11955 [Actinoalloteichus sp. AHMU CJ021]
MVTVVALACGNRDFTGLTERDDVVSHSVAATPGREEVDPVLRELAGRRLLVAGTDADLASVVLRLLRTERLAEVVVGYLPSDPDSEVARLWGLPARDREAALRLALGGEPDPVPLLRDDVGGVLVGRGVIGPLRGVVYCDDELVLRGQASQLEVGPDRGPGLVVRTVRRNLLGRRVRETSGRAVQIGCVPARVVRDGVPHERQHGKWTWYRHTEDLRLVRGLV